MPKKSRSSSKKSAKTTIRGKVRSAQGRGEELAVVHIDETAVDFDQYLKFTGGSLSSAIKLLGQPNKQEAIERAQDNKGDDLIGSILETKVDFYSAGFSVQVTSIGNKGNKEELKGRIVRAEEKFDLKKIACELIEDWENCDNSILQWKISPKKGLEYVLTLDPKRVRYSNAVGHEILQVRIEEEMVNHIRNELGAGAERERSLRRSVPKKYIDAVTNGDNWVKLSNDDGEYWIVKTRGRRYMGLATPSQQRIFLDIILRRLLISGDWTLAYFVKRLIEIVRSGESVSSGPNAGTKKLYMTPKDRTQLENIFKNNTSQALRLFANHTVDVKHIAPDAELFTEIKFAKVEERILRWGSVIDVIMTGRGDGFAQSTLGVRRFVAHGRRARSTIGSMFEEFFSHPSVRLALNIPAASKAKITWDEQTLKDDKQIMDELVALMDRGAMDVQTAIERMGHNYQVIKQRKRDQKKDDKFWIPNFEPRQGLLPLMMDLIDGEMSRRRNGAEDEPGRKRSRSEKTEPNNKPRPSRTRS